MRPLTRSNLALVLGLTMLSLPVGVSGQDLAGTWAFVVSAVEGSHSFTMTLAMDGEAVTGTAAGDETFTGTFKDGTFEISGEHYVDEAGYSAEIWLSGKISDDTITGEGTWDTFQLELAGKRES